jgi:hypothetical protein
MSTRHHFNVSRPCHWNFHNKINIFYRYILSSP